MNLFLGIVFGGLGVIAVVGVLVLTAIIIHHIGEWLEARRDGWWKKYLKSIDDKNAMAEIGAIIGHTRVLTDAASLQREFRGWEISVEDMNRIHNLFLKIGKEE